MRFNDKVCMVLGGGGGMGAAACRIFGAEGGKTAVCDLNLERAEAVAEEIRNNGGIAKAWAVDCSKEESIANTIQEIVEEFGSLDVAFNAFSGRALTPDICEVSEELFRKVIDSYLTYFFFAIKQEAIQMVKQGGGSIVSLTSVNAFTAVRGQPVYNAAKAGFDILCKTLAVEIGPKHVRVNTVAPGTTNTNLLGDSLKNEELRNEVLYKTPLKRINEPEDVAQAVAFLASDDARQITGVQLIVDGGCYLKGFPESYEIANHLPRHYVPENE